MKIKETYNSFTDEGYNAHFIVMDENGAYKDIDDITKLAVHFPRIVIMGDEALKEKEDIAKLVKKCTKLKPNIIFEIYTDGTEQPVKVTNYKNIRYNVMLKMKSSKIAYDERIIPKVISWFSEASTRFIFDIKKDDDLDEANMIIRDNPIRKHQIFLRFVGHPTEEELKKIIQQAIDNGYNFLINWKEIFWPEVGKHE